jgi:hypothetical protein
MRYGYDMEKHFDRVRQKTPGWSEKRDDASTTGRVYLTATAPKPRPLGDEPMALRLINWMRSRKP